MNRYAFMGATAAGLLIGVAMFVMIDLTSERAPTPPAQEQPPTVEPSALLGQAGGQCISCEACRPPFGGGGNTQIASIFSYTLSGIHNSPTNTGNCSQYNGTFSISNSGQGTNSCSWSGGGNGAGSVSISVGSWFLDIGVNTRYKMTGIATCDANVQLTLDTWDAQCQNWPQNITLLPSGLVPLCGNNCGNGTIDSGEDCDKVNGAFNSCCNSSTCKFKSSSTSCRASAGTCDKEEKCTGSADSCPSDAKEGTSKECRSASGACDVAETCNGSSNDCPSDVAASSSTVCRSAAGTCDKEEKCDGSSKSCPSDTYQPSTTVCRTAAGVCDKEEKCSGSSTSCPADTKLPSSTVCRVKNGTCDAPDTCDGTTNNCPSVDDVAAAGTVCRTKAGVCDAEESCDGSSRECPADKFAAATFVCRAASGLCDERELCSGTSSACPADAKKAQGTVCRATGGACDIEEICDGQSNSCPQDKLSPKGTVCRTSGGECDIVEKCSGTAKACPQDRVQNAGVVCRAKTGYCDTAEKCQGGGNPQCPADAFLPATTVCQPSKGVCDKVENCTGSAAACPADTKFGSDKECRAKHPERKCDAAETCDGTTDKCPKDIAAASGTVCRAAAGDCDAVETCGGTSMSCPADRKISSGTVCREAAGVCDRVEKCTGGNNCPQDSFKGHDSVCRPSTRQCDPAERCAGGTAECPADVNRCTGSSSSPRSSSRSSSSSSSSSTSPYCGDGVVQAPEQCDEPAPSSTTSSTTSSNSSSSSESYKEYITTNGRGVSAFTVVNCRNIHPSGEGWSFVKRACLWASEWSPCFRDACLWSRETTKKFDYKLRLCGGGRPEGYHLKSTGCVSIPPYTVATFFMPCPLSQPTFCFFEKELGEDEKPPEAITITHDAWNPSPGWTAEPRCDLNRNLRESGFDSTNRVCVLPDAAINYGQPFSCRSDLCLWKKSGNASSAHSSQASSGNSSGGSATSRISCTAGKTCNSACECITPSSRSSSSRSASSSTKSEYYCCLTRGIACYGPLDFSRCPPNVQKYTDPFECDTYCADPSSSSSSSSRSRSSSRSSSSSETTHSTAPPDPHYCCVSGFCDPLASCPNPYGSLTACLANCREASSSSATTRSSSSSRPPSSSSARSMSSAYCGNLRTESGEQCGEPGLTCAVGSTCGRTVLRPGASYSFNIVFKTGDAACNDTIENVAIGRAKLRGIPITGTSSLLQTVVHCAGGGGDVSADSPLSGPTVSPDVEQPTLFGQLQNFLGSLLMDTGETLRPAPGAIDPSSCETCETCGEGLFNLCDAEECGAPSCNFSDGWFVNSCAPNPQICIAVPQAKREGAPLLSTLIPQATAQSTCTPSCSTGKYACCVGFEPCGENRANLFPKCIGPGVPITPDLTSTSLRPRCSPSASATTSIQGSCTPIPAVEGCTNAEFVMQRYINPTNPAHVGPEPKRGIILPEGKYQVTMKDGSAWYMDTHPANRPWTPYVDIFYQKNDGIYYETAIGDPQEFYATWQEGGRAGVGKSIILSLAPPEGDGNLYLYLKDDRIQGNHEDGITLRVYRCSEPVEDPCAHCDSCGAGGLNTCDEAECSGLGSCQFTNGLLGNSCSPDPAVCGGGASSSSSSAGSCTSAQEKFEYTMTVRSNENPAPYSCRSHRPGGGGWTLHSYSCLIQTASSCINDACLWQRPTTRNLDYSVGLCSQGSPGPGWVQKGAKKCVDFLTSNAPGNHCINETSPRFCLWEKEGGSTPPGDMQLGIDHWSYANMNKEADCTLRGIPTGENLTLTDRVCIWPGASSGPNCRTELCLYKGEQVCEASSSSTNVPPNPVCGNVILEAGEECENNASDTCAAGSTCDVTSCACIIDPVSSSSSSSSTSTVEACPQGTVCTAISVEGLCAHLSIDCSPGDRLVTYDRCSQQGCGGFCAGCVSDPQSVSSSSASSRHSSFSPQREGCLTVTKTGPTSVEQGEDLAYIVTVTNNCDADVTDVFVHDTIPGDTTFASYPNSHPLCGEQGQEVVCRISDCSCTAPSSSSSSSSTSSICGDGIVSASEQCENTNPLRETFRQSRVIHTPFPTDANVDANGDGSVNGQELCSSYGMSCITGYRFDRKRFIDGEEVAARQTSTPTCTDGFDQAAYVNVRTGMGVVCTADTAAAMQFQDGVAAYFGLLTDQTAISAAEQKDANSDGTVSGDELCSVSGFDCLFTRSIHYGDIDAELGYNITSESPPESCMSGKSIQYYAQHANESYEALCVRASLVTQHFQGVAFRELPFPLENRAALEVIDTDDNGTVTGEELCNSAGKMCVFGEDLLHIPDLLPDGFGPIASLPKGCNEGLPLSFYEQNSTWSFGALCITGGTNSCSTGMMCNFRECSCVVGGGTCGDGTAQTGEQCGEPGLTCPESQSCNLSTCHCSGGGLCENDDIDDGEQCNEPGLFCPEGQSCDDNTCLCSGGGLCGNGDIDTAEQCNEPGLFCPEGQNCGEITCLCSGGGLCGNDEIDDGEECGEPGLTCPSGQTCNTNTCGCSSGGECGNDEIDEDEDCGEPGLSCPSGQTCNETSCICSGGGFCGNEEIDDGEQCNEPGLYCPEEQNCNDTNCLCSGGDLCGNGEIDDNEDCGEPGLFCPLSQTCNETNCICSGGDLCGNDEIDSGEQCGEPGLFCPDSQECNDTNCLCSGGNLCGNGEIDDNEDCGEPGLICPSGQTCNESNCLCSGAGEQCGNGEIDGGEQCGEPGLFCPDSQECNDTNCLCGGSGEFCGNGEIDDNEDCGEPGLSCPSGQTCNDTNCLCSGAGECANDEIDSGEQCNEPGLFCPEGQTCNETSCLCAGAGVCGNDEIDGAEECGESGLACPVGQSCNETNCLCSGGTVCGNDEIDENEQCNEPGLFCPEGQSCNTNTCLCSGGGLCGNGDVDEREECGEPGLSCDVTETCNPTNCLCVRAKFCGNAVLEPPEECEDGNAQSDDGCSSTCKLEKLSKFCGDGIITVGEECDDKNHRDFDGCSAECLSERGKCGDGFVQRLLGEQCEPSTHDASLPYLCSADCRFHSLLCGDGKVDPGEECDQGNRNADTTPNACRTNCSLARCGDRVVDGNEQCDDGNFRTGDGCDRACKTEAQAPPPVVAAKIVDLPVLPLPVPEQVPLPRQGAVPLPVPQPIGQVITRLSTTRGPVGDTGPAAIAVMTAGAAAGFAWMRRRRKR
ncbi:MAG: DUF4215 domain-containing protein [Candidatus Peregrinibacteria bacterium]|nr:DUF4215 domain-containing protein [Candidatus Peregrinibacteria bacterium]